MFSARVKDGEVRISGTNNIVDIMMGVTLIVRSVYECEKISKRDRETFKSYVEEELGKIAFLDEEGIVAEEKRMEKKVEEQKKRLEKAEKGLVDQLAKILLDIFEDDDSDGDKDAGEGKDEA